MSLIPWIREIAGADSVSVEDGGLLSGGAIQENRSLNVRIHGGENEGEHEFVLRSEPLSTVPESRPLEQQFRLIEAAMEAGVTVPEPMWYCSDPTVAGKPFYIMRRIYGEALGVRITRMGPMPEIAATLGGELAHIHTIRPPSERLDFLEPISASPALDAVTKYRAYLDQEPEPHPALEWTLRWLEVNAPPAGEIVLCHRDFRTGNYMVNGGELTGVLDWEFAGWGDPHEDLAWFCARCWRFSDPSLEAGGISDRKTFFGAYEKASGRMIDLGQIAYWEAMAHVRWSVIALHQAMRHRSGREPSLELALIGRRIAELEYECLKLTGAL